MVKITNLGGFGLHYQTGMLILRQKRIHKLLPSNDRVLNGLDVTTSNVEEGPGWLSMASALVCTAHQVNSMDPSRQTNLLKPGYPYKPIKFHHIQDVIQCLTQRLDRCRMA